MSRSFLIPGVVVAVAVVLISLSAGNAQQEETEPNREIEQGRYLVHQVCLCIICHSPRQADGEIIESQLLTGGTIPVSSPNPSQEWAFRAPKLRGLPAGWTEEEFIHFLQTREAPRGRSVRLPMPPFHLNERDARAVAAYLKSLG